MGWRSYSRFPKNLNVGERRAKAEKAVQKLGRKQHLDPVQIEGPLAVTWWGKAWNRNLEGYADYSNRLPRGRSYAKHGSVIDLRIAAGSVESLVQGSSSRPYAIKITIQPMAAAASKALLAACAGKLDSAEALLSGRFPEDLGRLLTETKTGLFPNPKDIRFTCSCPDSAYMCKHIAATLYGAGARLDRDPSLFFLLRNLHMEDFVSHAIKTETKKMLTAKGTGESARLKLGTGDLGSLFGVELEPVKVKRAKAKVESTPAKTLGKRKKASSVKEEVKSTSRALKQTRDQVDDLVKKLLKLSKT